MNYFIPQIHKHDSKGTEERRNEHIHGALRTESPEPIQSEDIDIRTASTSAISRSIGSVDGTRTGSLRQPDSASQNTHEYPPPPLTLVLSQQWHPKLTLYRFLVILTTLGFGISKAVLSYQGHSIVPITLEWLFTTGVFLLFFSLDTYQDNSQVKLPWLFHVDLSYAIWKRICNLFGITNPTFYRTEEQIRRQSSVANEHPPIRGYDLLVTLSTAVVGMTKSILAYQGRNTAVTSIDWVGTVVLGVGLYWLGLYASNPVGLMPYLFTTDYSDTIKANLASPYNPISFLPQLGIMALACWWSYKCVGWTIFLATMSYDTEVNFFRVVLERYVIPCRKVAYVSGGAACIGAGVFVVLVMTISRLRLGRFIESASLLWHYTGFFFRIFGFYVFMISHLAAFVITYIPAALALMGVHGVLGTIVVMIGVEISFFSLWWLCKALMKELWVLAKTVVRPLWRVFAGRLVRRRRTGSMGV